MPKKITPIGVGRKDFSDNVELSVLPTPRSWQESVKDFEEFEIGPRSEYSFVRSYEYTHYVLQAVVTVNANVLIDVTLQAKVGGDWLTALKRNGYQTVKIDIPASYPFDELKVIIKNNSNIKVKGMYYHFGIAGLEKVGYHAVITPT